MSLWDLTGRHFLNWWSMVQSMVGGIGHGLVFLDSIRKQAEQAKGRKPVSSPPPWPLHQFLPSRILPYLNSCPGFLWWWTAMCRYKKNKPFPLQLAFWFWYLVTTIKKKQRHQVSFLRIKSRGLNSSQNSQAESRGKIFNAAEKHVYIYRTENVYLWKMENWRKNLLIKRNLLIKLTRKFTLCKYQRGTKC